MRTGTQIPDKDFTIAGSERRENSAIRVVFFGPVSAPLRENTQNAWNELTPKAD
jgi:hypothetical protein